MGLLITKVMIFCSEDSPSSYTIPLIISVVKADKEMNDSTGMELKARFVRDERTSKYVKLAEVLVVHFIELCAIHVVVKQVSL